MSVLAWAKGDKPGPGGRPQESSLESRHLTVYTPRGGRAPKSGSGPSDRGRISKTGGGHSDDAATAAFPGVTERRIE